MSMHVLIEKLGLLRTRSSCQFLELVHVDCRTDGPYAAAHLDLDQHQGTARFLLRDFRFNWWPGGQCPHLPVRLGAMSEAVRQQVRIQGDNLRPDDVLVTNHPQAGGSHLPDITVITPCWQDGQPFFMWQAGVIMPILAESLLVRCHPSRVH